MKNADKLFNSIFTDKEISYSKTDCEKEIENEQEILSSMLQSINFLNDISFNRYSTELS